MAGAGVAEHLRMSVLQGDALDLAADPSLQEIAAAALKTANGSWSAIRLLLRQTMIVRAQCNVPRELAQYLAIESGKTFCADVVHTASRIAIEDVDGAHERTRSPRTRAYLGQPIFIDGVAVGALSVHDDKPRSFAGVELESLAARAGQRLALLACRRNPNRRLLDLAMRPAFAEIRNDLTPLQADLMVAQETLHELVTQGANVRQQEVQSIESMRASLAGLQRAARRLTENLSSLQLLCCGEDRAIVGEVVQASDELAYHHTHLIGGVHWTVQAPLAPLDVSQRTSVSVITASLSMLALRLGDASHRTGLRALVDKQSGGVRFRLHADLDSTTLRECATAVADLVDSSQVAIHSAADAFQIILPAA